MTCAATGPTDDVAYLAELLEKLGERHSAYITDQKQAQVRVEAMIGRWQAPIEQPVLHFDDIMDKLGTIDRRVTAVHEALPRTPSIAGLAAAIVAVLTLGTGAGLALIAAIQSAIRPTGARVAPMPSRASMQRSSGPRPAGGVAEKVTPALRARATRLHVRNGAIEEAAPDSPAEPSETQ